MLKPLKKGNIFVLSISDKLDLNVELSASVNKSLAEKEAKLYVIDVTQMPYKHAYANSLLRFC